ncbi:MAG: hypothetical protein IPJ36_16895 [Simplicispira sp.]|nr:hypothetical protein [Simplicispira sp.]
MQTVMKNFSTYKAVEMVLLIVGVGMIAFLQRQDMAAGIGVGPVLQAAFTLTLDILLKHGVQITCLRSVRFQPEALIRLCLDKNLGPSQRRSRNQHGVPTPVGRRHPVSAFVLRCTPVDAAEFSTASRGRGD